MGLIRKYYKYLKKLEVVDYRIIVSIVFLMLFGFIMIFSAGCGMTNLIKQVLIGSAGFVLMIFISYVDYHVYVKHAWKIYLVALVSLFLVRLPGIGASSNGASRWISIAGITLQPAEFMKPAIVILLAMLIRHMGRKMASLPGLIIFFFPGVVGAVAIYLITNNLSTALIVAGIVVIMFFVAYPGRMTKWVILAIAVVAGAVFWLQDKVSTWLLIPSDQIVNNFRALRILAWLYPEQYTQSSLQTRYSMYSIAFGGLLGRGLGAGTMKYYLPEPTNDFIFAVIAEELGIVGCGLVIFLFIYQIYRIMTVARHAKDRIGNYIALGIGAHVALQVILNIGVASGILPNTGVSLPYISYGGTALLIQLCEMGIVLNISRQIPGKKVVVQGTSGSISTETQVQQRKTA